MLFTAEASDLLQRIPLSARTILDVGCGEGTLLAAYRPMNPKARLLGIDLDPDAASRAAAHLDEAASIDAETNALPFDLRDGIDCIIYDGILEHLRDPWGLIRRHAEMLSPDGVMLICVPNVEYWRFTECLLRGAWNRDGEPHPAGTYFFSLDSMREKFAQADLTLCDVTVREPDDQVAAAFAATLAPGLAGIGVDPENYAKRAAASHLIWRVRKEPRPRMILSGTMLDPVGGVSHVRVVYPLQAIGTDPMVTTGVTNQVAIGDPNDGMARIFVLHRPALFGNQGYDTFRRLTDAGFLIVTEFDDLPDHFDMMRMGGALSFYGAHAVQTSTTSMADALRQYNPEIAVFPNAVGSLPAITNFADPNTITLFFGALNRQRDWAPFMPALNEVAAMAGERLKFQVVHDQAFFEALETPHKAFTPTCDYPTYLRLLGGSEISFMPLADTRFSRAKSDLKFIEAASCRTAALASSVVYGNSIEDGRTGLLFRDTVEFRAMLLRLLAMPELARALGDAGRRYVAGERMLAYQVAPRIAWYRSLWTRRDALEAIRRERMQRYRGAA
jgi:SAM-dependent methyltransferase